MIKELTNCERDEEGKPVPTARQRALQEYFADMAYQFPEGWFKGEDVYLAMQMRGFDYGNPKTAYKKINEDVRFLNVCGLYTRMVIGDRTKGYKLATREEFLDWCKRQREEAVGKLNLLSYMMASARLDDQERLAIQGGAGEQ